MEKNNLVSKNGEKFIMYGVILFLSLITFSQCYIRMTVQQEEYDLRMRICELVYEKDGGWKVAEFEEGGRVLRNKETPEEEWCAKNYHPTPKKDGEDNFPTRQKRQNSDCREYEENQEK